jgi:hypothetical protein
MSCCMFGMLADVGCGRRRCKWVSEWWVGEGIGLMDVWMLAVEMDRE